MRIVIIDPYQEMLIESQFDGNIKTLYKLLSPPNEKPVNMVERVIIHPEYKGQKGTNSLWVDESGRFNDRKYGFKSKLLYPEPLAGIGVMIGETPITADGEGGDWCDCSIDPLYFIENGLMEFIEFGDIPEPTYQIQEFESICELLDKVTIDKKTDKVIGMNQWKHRKILEFLKNEKTKKTIH